ncbi:hypothetical protein AGMMS49521_3660 [Campylobacterota bacterium]|nr:hypothetical protein AGMMS49521_3660 [Campylobacterota bacterium]
MKYGVPVVLIKFAAEPNRYACVQIVHSGGEYQGKKIAYIDPKSIEVTLVRDDGRHIQPMSLVDGILYCTSDKMNILSDTELNVQVVVKNPLFADEIMYKNMSYTTNNVAGKINPTTDPTSYTSRAVANKVVGVTGMPTLAEVQAEMDRMRSVYAEQERITEEKAKAEREAKEKAKQAAEKAREREQITRFYSGSAAYRAGYSGMNSIGNVWGVGATEWMQTFCSNFGNQYSECVQGAQDARSARRGR